MDCQFPITDCHSVSNGELSKHQSACQLIDTTPTCHARNTWYRVKMAASFFTRSRRHSRFFGPTPTQQPARCIPDRRRLHPDFWLFSAERRGHEREGTGELTTRAGDNRAAAALVRKNGAPRLAGGHVAAFLEAPRSSFWVLRGFQRRIRLKVGGFEEVDAN